MANETTGELAEALVAVRLRDSDVDTGLAAVKQKLEAATAEADENPVMGKLLFGRRGAEGFGETVEHSLTHAILGPMSRMFMMGGGLGLLAGELAHFGVEAFESWIHGAEEAAEEQKKATEEIDKLVEGFDKIEESSERAMRAWSDGLIMVMDKMREAEAEDRKLIANLSFGGGGGSGSATDVFAAAAAKFQRKNPFQQEQEEDRQKAAAFVKEEEAATRRSHELYEKRLAGQQEILKLERERDQQKQAIDAQAIADHETLAKSGHASLEGYNEIFSKSLEAKDKIDRDYAAKEDAERFKITEEAIETNRIAHARTAEMQRKADWQAGLADRMKAADEAAEHEKQKAKEVHDAQIDLQRAQREEESLKGQIGHSDERLTDLQKRTAEREDRTRFIGLDSAWQTIQSGIGKKDPLQEEILKEQQRHTKLLERLVDTRHREKLDVVGVWGGTGQ